MSEESGVFVEGSLAMLNKGEGNAKCILFGRMGHIWLETVISREKTMGRQKMATGVPFARVDHTVDKVVTIAAIESKVVTIKGKLGRATVDILLDLGSSVSLVWKEVLQAAEM